jgi:hypothetical protein
MADASPSTYTRSLVSFSRRHHVTKEFLMKKTKTSALLCVVALIVAGLALNNYVLIRGQVTAQQSTTTDPIGTKQSPSPSQAREHIVYRQFFRHVVALKQRATEMETQGKNGKVFRAHYKDKIGLKDKEANLLDEIAAECERETAKVDAKAQRIIELTRARVQNGRAVSIDQIPPPPPELKKLQRQRDMIVMRARYRLVSELGAYGFQRVDDFIKLNFARDVQPAAVRPKQLRSAQQDASPAGNQ